jgi:hypothetical protein
MSSDTNPDGSTPNVREMYRQLETPQGAHIEHCPICEAEAALWQFSETPDAIVQRVAMCSHRDEIGPQDGIVNSGCLLYMPDEAFYQPTAREAIRYWNSFAVALRELRAGNAPAADSQKSSPERCEPAAQWDDPRVQTVYEVLCSDEAPPPEQHWEGWLACRIVGALDGTTAAQPDPTVMQYLALTDAMRYQAGEQLLSAEEYAATLYADAARYRWLRNRTCGVRDGGLQRLALPSPRPLGNIMQGAVCQHLDNAIDAALAGSALPGTSPSTEPEALETAQPTGRVASVATGGAHG